RPQAPARPTSPGSDRPIAVPPEMDGRGFHPDDRLRPLPLSRLREAPARLLRERPGAPGAVPARAALRIPAPVPGDGGGAGVRNRGALRPRRGRERLGGRGLQALVHHSAGGDGTGLLSRDLFTRRPEPEPL